MSIELKYSDNCKATIYEQGAELIRLTLSGRELLWSGDPAYWGRTSPFLFPMVGSLKNGETSIYGRKFNIPKHGFCRDARFAVSQIAANDVTFTYEANHETYEMFPFMFEVKIRYQLLKGRLKIFYSVKNNEEKREMPFCIGAHPAIAVPFGDKFLDEYDTFGNYKIIFEKPENTESIRYDVFNGYFDPRLAGKKLKGQHLNLKHSDYVEDCLYFNNLESKSILISRDMEHGVTVSWEGFTGVAFWTPMQSLSEAKKATIDSVMAAENADFICVEPWCSSADFKDDDGTFTNKRGIESAVPGETKKYSVIIGEV